MASSKDFEKLSGAYRRLFSTNEGALVLEDLRRLYYDSPMTGDKCSTDRELGRRDVVYRILQRMIER